MRVSRTEMDASHHRIVEGASRLMRERGVSGMSVADAMSAADMTHGGFYRHFSSKDELVHQALESAFSEFLVPLETRQQAEAPQKVVKDYKALYLSPEHVANPGQGCPMPALGSEMARAAGPVRAGFAAGVRKTVAALGNAQVGNAQTREASAIRELAMLVGAVVLARASDEETANWLLDACRR